MKPHAPQPLWPHAAPDSNEAAATLTWYPTEADPNGACVMVCPGGGYGHLAPHEGEPIARWFNARGFHAAVLHYRIGPTNRHPAPVQDAQRALRLLRSKAGELGFRPESIAVLGFSAGGHLASSLAVHYEDFHCAADDLAGRVSARPDAAVLCYAVIDIAGAAAHTGSRANLLGPNPEPHLPDLMSTHRQVTADTPPTFLWTTADDPVVPLDNSLQFASACRRNEVPVEMHVYESGRHGLGLADEFADIRTWTDFCAAFLTRHLVK